MISRELYRRFERGGSAVAGGSAVDLSTEGMLALTDVRVLTGEPGGTPLEPSNNGIH